jgi:anti-sigma-K factor RskA
MAIECKTALERLLEADPAELSGRGDSELATHLQECERCAAVAKQLLAGQQELAAELGELGPRTGVEEALSRARVRRRQVARRRNTWRVAAPLAAAAAVTAVLLVGSPDGRMPGEIVSLPAPRIEPVVEVAAAQNVMVFETQDQSAKVIWFY